MGFWLIMGRYSVLLLERILKRLPAYNAETVSLLFCGSEIRFLHQTPILCRLSSGLRSVVLLRRFLTVSFRSKCRNCAVHFASALLSLLTNFCDTNANAVTKSWHNPPFLFYSFYHRHQSFTGEK